MREASIGSSFRWQRESNRSCLQTPRSDAAHHCFGPRIRSERFPKGFTLPRDTPKYNGSAKPEDWLADYVTAINIAGGNKRVAVRYVPLMLQGSARTWLNSLPKESVNSWLDFEEVFNRNFTGTYLCPGNAQLLAMCRQKDGESDRAYLTRWTSLRNSCEGILELQAVQYFVQGCRDEIGRAHV